MPSIRYLGTFIGQAPSRSTEGSPPFHGRSGFLLAELLHMSRDKMLDAFRFINLLDHFPGTHISGKGDLFDHILGSEKALELLPLVKGRVALLGKNVLRCFTHGYPRKDFFEIFQLPGSCAIFSAIPHPSGISRWYNVQSNKSICSRHLENFFKLETTYGKESRQTDRQDASFFGHG